MTLRHSLWPCPSCALPLTHNPNYKQVHVKYMVEREQDCPAECRGLVSLVTVQRCLLQIKKPRKSMRFRFWDSRKIHWRCYYEAAIQCCCESIWGPLICISIKCLYGLLRRYIFNNDGKQSFVCTSSMGRQLYKYIWNSCTPMLTCLPCNDWEKQEQMCPPCPVPEFLG